MEDPAASVEDPADSVEDPAASVKDLAHFDVDPEITFCFSRFGLFHFSLRHDLSAGNVFCCICLYKSFIFENNPIYFLCMFIRIGNKVCGSSFGFASFTVALVGSYTMGVFTGTA